MKNKITTIGIALSLISAPVAYDSLTLTDKEINQVREEVNFTPDEDLIYKTILLDKKNIEFDLSVISKQEVDNLLMGTLLKLGISQEDLMERLTKGEQISFDKEIKKKSKKKTSVIRNL